VDGVGTPSLRQASDSVKYLLQDVETSGDFSRTRDVVHRLYPLTDGADEQRHPSDTLHRQHKERRQWKKLALARALQTTHRVLERLVLLPASTHRQTDTLEGNWTTRGYANSRTGHLTDWSTHGLDNLHTSQLADWTTRGLTDDAKRTKISMQSRQWHP